LLPARSPESGSHSCGQQLAIQEPPCDERGGRQLLSESRPHLTTIAMANSALLRTSMLPLNGHHQLLDWKGCRSR
jgi:hypothetical protein